MRRYSKGFTLIELLIVVAIIAVLAAIAVPNFLEARTRAVVSRLMSDMRTVGTALEVYRVDNNSYISAYYPARDPGVWGEFFFLIEAPNYFGGIGKALTTPVAYLSSIPDDPFSFRSMNGRPQLWAQGGIKRASFLYQVSLRGNINGAAIPAGYESVIKGKRYLLHSPGPNILFWPHDGDPELYYDPTNGTVSKGDMWYVGGGGKFLGTGTR